MKTFLMVTGAVWWLFVLIAFGIAAVRTIRVVLRERAEGKQ